MGGRQQTGRATSQLMKGQASALMILIEIKGTATEKVK